jgi:hypothetical protein
VVFSFLKAKRKLRKENARAMIGKERKGRICRGKTLEYSGAGIDVNLGKVFNVIYM